MNNQPDTSKSVHLTASAGSGKTRALKERYLALLDTLDVRGLSTDQAVAITFTDKAAAEIKERVMRGLPEAMLKKIIRGRQDLRISTIHSFCMNLLKRYPLEAGLPPDFTVLNTSDQTSKIDRAIDDTLEHADMDSSFMEALASSSAAELFAFVKQLLSIRSRLKRMEIDAGGPEAFVRQLQSDMGINDAEAEMVEVTESEEWRGLFQQMELLLRTQGAFHETCDGPGHAALSRAASPNDALRIVPSILPLYFTQKNEPRKRPPITKAKFANGTTFVYPDYEALALRIQDMLTRFMTAYRRVLAGRKTISLLHLFQQAESRYQESKLREGLLDFDDLEIFAYHLLKSQDSPDILYWLDRKILHFLVDEFQDTSDIQWAILNKLTEEIFSGQGTDKPMRPTLFVVGDEKQSIYRFREANYRLMNSIRLAMERNIPAHDRDIRTLDTNFRSTPEIVDTVNAVFSSLWPESFNPSRADRVQHHGSVRLIELLPAAPDNAVASLDEAAILAREIRALIDNTLPVYDQSGSGQLRPAEYDDCAILIQARTKLKDYEAALRRENIPFRVVGGIGFYEEDEIQALINVLFFLKDKDDKLAFAAMLKSPLFDMSDQELFEIVRTGGELITALQAFRPDDARHLRAWSDLAGLVPLSTLIHRIVADTGAYIRFGRLNQQSIFNIDKLLDTGREFDRRGYTTLQDFVDWVKNIKASEQREAAADMNLPGFRGAVSIMTVHKAKGLEYPIVFLPGLNNQMKSMTKGPAVLISGETGMNVAIRDTQSPVYKDAWEREQEELRSEHQRLLYVAMTRARDHLIMIGTLFSGRTAIKQHTWLSYIHASSPKPLFDALHDLQDGTRRYAFPDTAQNNGALPNFRGSAEASLTFDKVDAGSQRFTADNLVTNLAPISSTGVSVWHRATDFIDSRLENAPVRPPLAAAPGAVSLLVRGSILHRCLEDQAKYGSFDIKSIVAGHPDLQRRGPDIVHSFITDAQTLLDSILANHALAWIFDRSLQAFSELPFLYKRDHTFVSGIMDRVVIREDTAQVVDYKSILIEHDDALKAWSDHYRPQLRIYCEAARQIFQTSSATGYLLFLDSNRLEQVVTVS